MPGMKHLLWTKKCCCKWVNGELKLDSLDHNQSYLHICTHTNCGQANVMYIWHGSLKNIHNIQSIQFEPRLYQSYQFSAYLTFTCLGWYWGQKARSYNTAIDASCWQVIGTDGVSLSYTLLQCCICLQAGGVFTSAWKTPSSSHWIKHILKIIATFYLTNCGLSMVYGDLGLGQHWFR